MATRKKSKSVTLRKAKLLSSVKVAAVETEGLTEQPPSNRVLEAALELRARRTARKSVIEFCQFTHPRYQPNWHHHEIAELLEALSWSKLDVDGIIIEAPPRHGKSEEAVIRWPAWDLGERPHEHFIALAYGDELANTFSRACRNTIETPQYQRLWKHKLKTRNDTKWELERKDDDQRATYIASGILSSITGEGATKLIVDDPVKNHEEAYSKKIRDKIYDNYLTAASTRMSPGGKKVIIMTRWHEDDLVGRLVAKAKSDKKADQWIVICLAATNDEGQDSYIFNTKTGEKFMFPAYKALWPEAYPREELDRIKANIGSVYFSALYMQAPTPASGGIFKRENWGYFDQRPTADLMIQVYDTAFAEGQTNDYSASITLGHSGGFFPVFDAWRDKIGFPALVAKVYERWEMCSKVYGRYPDRICVENKGSGISLIQQIETNNLAGMWTFPNGTTKQVPFIPVTPMPATVGKVIRAQGISGYHESKGILLPRGADWVGDFVDELALFDKGPHDDYVDTLVHGVTYYVRPIEEREEMVTHSEGIVISSELDDFDMEMAFQGRGAF